MFRLALRASLFLFIIRTALSEESYSLYVDCTLSEAADDCTIDNPCSSVSRALEVVSERSTSGDLATRAHVHMLPGVCTGDLNSDLLYNPLLGNTTGENINGNRL